MKTKSRNKKEYKKVAKLESKAMEELTNLLTKWVFEYKLSPTEITGILLATSILFVQSVQRLGRLVIEQQTKPDYVG